MRIITFFNNKGGVGKTTTVYHVAWMLSEMGIKTVAIDLDPQSNLTSMFLTEDRLEEVYGNNAPVTPFYFQPPPSALYNVTFALSCCCLTLTRSSSLFSAFPCAVMTSR